MPAFENRKGHAVNVSGHANRFQRGIGVGMVFWRHMCSFLQNIGSLHIEETMLSSLCSSLHQQQRNDCGLGGIVRGDWLRESGTASLHGAFEARVRCKEVPCMRRRKL